MDNFYEQLEVFKEKGTYNVARFMFYLFIALAVFNLVTLNILLELILIGLAVLMFFVKKRFYIEYEYVFTNGDIDIDKIIEMKKRKRAYEFNIKDVELLVPVESDEYKDHTKSPDTKVENFVVKGCEKKVYAAFLKKSAIENEIRFTPDEKFIELCFMKNPRAVKRIKI